MRKQLKELDDKLVRAIAFDDARAVGEVLRRVIGLLDMALPVDKSDDDDAAWEEARAIIARLRQKIDAALQRLNESGTGEMWLLNTIHATNAILALDCEQPLDTETNTAEARERLDEFHS